MSLKEMREIAEGRPPPVPGRALPAPVSLTSPGGLAVLVFDDGGALARVCLGHVDAEDGLIAEFRSGAEPAPWSSKAVRDEALASIADRKNLPDDLRNELLRHVRATPWFERDGA